MSFEPPDGILDIGNATLRVGKLEVAETSGLNQGLQNIIKNDLLITENTEYTIDQKWGLKLPTTWVAEFEVKGHSGKYIDFNFYNENSASNALGYNLTFMDTTMTLRYDGGSALGGGAATIPTIVGAYRKVNIFFERGVISVSIDGTRYLYHKETDGFNQNLGVASRVVSATGGAFVNVFIESDHSNNSGFKNLRIVNGRFISDKTSNIAFIGGNLGVGVNSPKETLDIRGNMHFNRVSNVSSISVDSNVVTEYTGPHDRPLRKYPEVVLTSATTGEYTASQSSENDATGNFSAWKAFDSSEAPNGTLAMTQSSQYNNTSGTLVYTGDKDLLGDSNYKGEWIKLELPISIAVKKIHLQPRTTFFDQTPCNFKIVGSNDNSSWDVLYHNNPAANTTIPSDTEQVHHMTHNLTKYYKYVALVANTTGAPISGNYMTMSVTNIEYYGHEEGSGSLDTTLKTVYNVPATTGTQLEVYYDAKGESTVQSPIPDLSPNTNTGALSTSPPTLDTTDGIESFKFDASSSQRITSTIDTSYWGTNKLHSVAFWFKADTINGKFNIFHIGNPAASESSGFWISDGSADSNSGNSLNWWFYGGDSTLKTSSFSWVSDTWYHTTLTFDGSTKKLYVNGKHIDYSVGNVITTLPTGIPASASLAVGSTTNSADYFDGSIANFRVYGAKVLNADQVKELYDYQKDYFLGSKSQVTLYKGHLGVGVTEPSGQLELAGDERLQEYPPRDLYQYDTNIEGHGVFCASASIEYTDGNHPPWEAFSDSATSASQESTWTTNGAIYNTTSGLYTGSTTTSGIKGEWIQLKTPYKIKVSSFNLNSYADASSNRQPRNFILLGSNDGNVWEQMKSVTDQTSGYTTIPPTYSGLMGPHYTINSTKYYSYFRIVVTANQGVGGGRAGDALVGISRIRFFGTPGPTTLDKGSLTLGRSLDVPRISRYDVDTETPRPEKLVVDFDTTVNSSPTDISGQANHGSFMGTPAGDANVNYSSADKAFVFNGTDDYIQTTPLGFSGDQVHSVSLWFWSDIEQSTFGNNEHALCGTGGVSNSTETGISIYNAYAQVWRAGGATKYPMTFNANQWNHICMAYSSGGSVNSRLWLNGVELAQDSSVTSTSTYSFQTGEYLILGTWINNATVNTNYTWDGKMSNFKLYNVALEPSEVKKLYNLGRTGRSMVISDTAVGIGKVPEAQLDVRGTISATSDIQVYSPDGISKIRTGKVGMFLQNSGRTTDPDTKFSPARPYSIWESNVGGEGSYIAINADNVVMCSPCDDESLRYYDEDNANEVWNISIAGALVVGSDSRRKRDIKPVIWENVLKKIGNIEPSTFKFKHPESYTRVTSKWDKEHIGFIAQNVQENFPELVTEDGSSENYLLVNSSMMILPIIQGIQQLTNELEAEKAKNESLETQVSDLLVRVTALENA